MQTDSDGQHDLSLLDEEKNFDDAPLLIVDPEFEVCIPI
jgi:hypothetical protein